MLGLLLLYFIGKAFFNLAKKHGRNKWLFAILSVVVYYGVLIIAGVIIALTTELGGNDASNIAAGLMAIPVALLAVWLFHYVLRKNWEGSPKDQHPDLLDSTNF